MEAMWDKEMVKGKSELDIDLNRVVSDPDYRRKVLRRLNEQRRAARCRPEWPKPPARRENGVGPDKAADPGKGARNAAQDPSQSDSTTGAPIGGAPKPKPK